MSTPAIVAVRWFEELGNGDVDEVGGKNASLGEMIGALKEADIRVPAGFATTADVYRAFVDENDLDDTIRGTLADMRDGACSLEHAGRTIRRAIGHGTLPDTLVEAVEEAYAELSSRYDTDEVDVAVRSSATAEDLPDASFAGQQETFLNVSGADDVLEAIVDCYASLFTDRAIAYREEQDFDHMDVALSVGVQKMVRSDRAGAGVMFSIDTETGFPRVVRIDAAWGLGESVVAGTVNPDSYLVFKPLLDDESLRPVISKERGEKASKVVYSGGGRNTTRTVDTRRSEQRAYVLSDDEVLRLARWAVAIEEHYERPMDIEWAKDGDTGDLYVVQARPETVQSQQAAGALHTYRLREDGEVLARGLAIGDAVATGEVMRIIDPGDMDRFVEGAILVTEMTDPDWVPVMRKAAAIVTDQGGRTAHAAIVSRELGIPAVVGTGDGTDRIGDGDEVTISCSEGDDGFVYEGALDYDEETIELDDLPEVETRIMMNIASPTAAFRWWRLPVQGIGLARMEFIINNHIAVHPLALTRFDELEDDEAREHIEALTREFDDRTDYFVERLARGVARIAAAEHPDPVIVRMSDFKTNEYANLIGGAQFEPKEANPMLGFRGASRYDSDAYRDGFALECRAIRRVRDEIGLRNVTIMIPFVRTLDEADGVLEVLAGHGLERGRDGLEIYVMCEVPSNVVLAEEFADRFDGFSIGSNDLTQLTLGVDRDSDVLAPLFDERDEAVKRMVAQVIEAGQAKGRKVGICGQAPSDYPEFAAFLVEQGIDSISLNPDSVVEVIRRVAEVEERLRAG